MAPGRDSLAVSAQQGQLPGQFQGQLPPGTVVGGRFRLEAVIGQDTVSQTYRATDNNRRGPAAVRIMPMRALGAAAAQLVTDIENASALVHKNLIEVLTAGREADYFFIATELLDGQTLREFIDGKQAEGRNVSFKGACNLITHVANGLERAAGFMPHGGLNPASIWVNKAGRVKVADLGLARTVPALARRGAAAGAPDHLYVAPEVLAGAPPSSASDVYSMAMLLYEVLTGHLPTNPFVPASQAVPEVPPVVDAILAKAFAAAPEHRFTTPMELRDALTATLSGGAPNVEQPAAAPRAAAAQPVQGAPVPEAASSTPRSTLGRSFNVAEAAGAAVDESQERWLVQKDRLDFGPFSLAQIRAQIARGEILGEHLLVDSDTGERQKVKDFPPLREFTKTSERHREQNRRAVAEQKAEKSDKRKSIFTFFFVLVALAAAVGGVVFYVWTRKAGDDTKIASRTDDADVDAFLKNVNLSFKRATVAKRGSSGGGHHASGADSEFNNDANFGDASKYASAGDETLDDGAIEETMMHHYRGLVPCLMAERKHNPGLTEMSLEFVVRGTGKVSAVKVNGQRGGFASCVQSRMPTFPKFNGSKTIASWSMSLR